MTNEGGRCSNSISINSTCNTRLRSQKICDEGMLVSGKVGARTRDTETDRQMRLGGVLKKNKKSNFFESEKKGANFRKMIFMCI